MTPDRWNKVEEIFDAGLELGEAEREALLAAVDREVSEQVRQLWRNNDQAGSFLGEPAVPPNNRTFSPGQTLAGRYVVEEFLGAGGMGEVYKARDTRLGRFVAIKALHSHLASDPSAVNRIEREARALSALSHPRICAIHDVAEENNVLFLVMEHLSGETLAARLAGGPIPLPELLSISEQVLDGLAFAHEHGVIHRDLKPANIMLTDVGVKILDFGIAKRTAAEPEADTVTLTSEGFIAGSVAYMSPEQAEGKLLDQRSDIFSLGSVLYEMTTGRRAFSGESNISTLAAVLQAEPEPVRNLAPASPPALEAIIRRCLERLHDDRYPSAAAVAEALGTLRPQVSRARGRWLAIGAAALAVVVVTAIMLWRDSSQREPIVGALELRRMTDDTGVSEEPDLSPDGKLLVYSSDRSGSFELWLQPVAGGDAIRLTKGTGNSSSPVFSPDGNEIAYHLREKGRSGVYVIPVLGGQPRELAPGGQEPQYSPDGRYVAYSQGTGSYGRAETFVRPASGGPPQQIAVDLISSRRPIFSPEGTRLLVDSGEYYDSETVLYCSWVDGRPSVRTDVVSALLEQKLESPVSVYGWQANFLLVSAKSGDTYNLWYVPFDSDRLTVTGRARRLTSGASLNVSARVRGSKIVFGSGSMSTNVWTLPLAPNLAKVLGPPRQVTDRAGSVMKTDISTDGHLLAYDYYSWSGTPAIVVRDFDSSEERMVPLPRDVYFCSQPRFFSDSRRLSFYCHFRDDPTAPAYTTPVTGGELQKFSDDCHWPSPSPSSRWMLCREFRNDRKATAIMVSDVTNGGRSEILFDGKANIWHHRFSPDEQWVSFVAWEGGRGSIFVVPFRGLTAVPREEWIQVSGAAQGYEKPRWSPDGNLIYHQSKQDGYLCIWAQRLNPKTKQPEGEPVAIYHSHGRLRLGLLGGEADMSVGSDKLAFLLPEFRSSVWITDLGPDFE